MWIVRITEPWDTLAAGTGGWPSVHVWEQSDAPSHGSGERRMFPGQPFLGVTHWELPLGGFGIPLHSAGPKSHFVTLLLAC